MTIDVSEMIVGSADRVDTGLVTGPTIMRIVGGSAVRENKAPRLRMEVDRFDLPWIPCMGLIRIMAGRWGRDASKWVGRYVEVYVEPDCSWAGKKTPGVRLCGMSDIDGDFVTLMREAKYKGCEGGGSGRTRSKEYPIRHLTADVIAKYEASKGSTDGDATSDDQLRSRIEAAVKYWSGHGISRAGLEALVGASVGEWGDAELAKVRRWASEIKAGTETIEHMREVIDGE